MQRRLVVWIHRRRPLLTAFFVLLVIAIAIIDPDAPVRLTRPRLDAVFLVAWVSMLVGVGVRIWGAGNLRKNQEITRSGVYRMVRHPLYFGSLAMFLALFITVGDPVLGILLFLAMVIFVYYPTMLDEEAHLGTIFPDQLAEHTHLSRLLPDPRRLGEALRSDRFTLEAAQANLGLRSLGFLVALPMLLEIIHWVENRF